MRLGHGHQVPLSPLRRPRNRTCLVALGAVALAAGAAGCGGREIEAPKAEAFVRGAVSPAPRAVDCPDGVEVEKGKTFECDVTTTDGGSATITVHIADEDGNVSVGAGDLKRR